jgi:hypothetical protein
MADALLETSDLQQPCASRHSVHDEESDDDGSTDGSISQTSSHRLMPYKFVQKSLSHRLMQRRSACRYLDNYPKAFNDWWATIQDFFFQEHLKSDHFTICEPLMAPHNDGLPDTPPLRAEIPFSLMTRRLTPVKVRDKLLSSRHIRLVKLFSPSHFDGSKRRSLRSQAGVLRCEVYQASLDDVPSDGPPLFAALSYACGNPDLTQRVSCGDDYVHTTHNLFEALLHVRHEDSSRLLWVDGLCINQEDVEERNHQVGMLHQIYSQAHVITWLGAGHDTDLTSLADYMSLAARVWTKVVRSDIHDGDFHDAAVALYEECSGRQAAKHPHQSWYPDMNQVVNAAYFTRVWVAQEIFLGKSATCQLGRHLFSVAVLRASLQLFRFHGGYDIGPQIGKVCDCYLSPSLTETWFTVQRSQSQIPFHLVKSFGGKQCLDPRDHIYGLSALFGDGDAYAVDYSLSVAEVFCNFAVYCLEDAPASDLWVFSLHRSIMQRGSLASPTGSSATNSSCTVSHTKGDFALPSWCPSWNRGHHPMSRVLVGQPWLFYSHGSGPRRLSWHRPSPLVITFKGCIVSKIIWCSTNTVMFQQPVVKLIVEAVEYLSGYLQHLRSWSSSARNLDLISLVLLAINTLLEYHAEAREFFPYSEDENDTHGLTHATWDLLRDTEAGYDLRKQLGPVFLATAFPDFYDVASPRIDTRISVDDYQTITDVVEHQIHQASWGCRLFVTDSEMFGTGLSGIMDGDVVCILFGSEVPYILRPTRTEGQYLLIGECYIEGLMRGAPMEVGLPEQKITLV